jgi:hypothetical protein
MAVPALSMAVRTLSMTVRTPAVAVRTQSVAVRTPPLPAGPADTERTWLHTTAHGRPRVG